MLQKQPGSRLVIPRLTSAAVGLLRTVVEAFPNDPEMDNGHLLTFEQAVKDLNRYPYADSTGLSTLSRHGYSHILILSSGALYYANVVP